MKFLTKADRSKLIKNHVDKKPVAYVKFFNPVGIGTWYISELDPDTNIMFGLCDLGFPELGYVSMDELEQTELQMELLGSYYTYRIERDLYFEPKKLQDIKNNLDKRL